MRTVAEILKEARLAKNLTYEQIEKATKIRAKFLQAIEEGEYNKLPGSIFAQGFVNNYADFLGLNKTQINALFRREFILQKTTSIIPERQKLPTFRFGRQFRSFLLLASILLITIIFILKSYLDYISSPKLIVNYPEDKISVAAREIEVAGWTETENQLYLNGQAVTPQNTGDFKEKITLNDGLNTITVTARNKNNRQTEIKRTIRLEL